MVSDSSKFCASYTFYQVDEQGRLLLVATDTRVLTGAECRKVAVYRELLCLTYGLEQIEHFIMASKKTILVIADAQSILYLKNAQPWDGALGKVALYVSRFPNLMYTFVPGRFMGLCDVLSRQFTDAFLTKTDAPLSKIMSENLPSHAKKLPKKELPNFMVKLLSYIDTSAKNLVPDLGLTMQTDQTYAEEILQMKFLPSETAVIDAAKSVVRLKLA